MKTWPAGSIQHRAKLRHGAVTAQQWETTAPTVLSARLPGWWLEKATLPSFVEKGVEGQEFFLTGF